MNFRSCVISPNTFERIVMKRNIYVCIPGVGLVSSFFQRNIPLPSPVIRTEQLHAFVLFHLIFKSQRDFVVERPLSFPVWRPFSRCIESMTCAKHYFKSHRFLSSF